MVAQAATFFVVPLRMLPLLGLLYGDLSDRLKIVVSRLRPTDEVRTDSFAEDMRTALVSPGPVRQLGEGFGRRNVVGSHTAATLAAR